MCDSTILGAEFIFLTHFCSIYPKQSFLTSLLWSWPNFVSKFRKNVYNCKTSVRDIFVFHHFYIVRNTFYFIFLLLILPHDPGVKINKFSACFQWLILKNLKTSVRDQKLKSCLAGMKKSFVSKSKMFISFLVHYVFMF